MNRLFTLLFLLLAGGLQAQVRTLSLAAQRTATAGAALTAYRANPLALTITLDATRPTLTGKESLVVELRRSATDTTTALAQTEILNPTGAGPFTLNLTGAQLNQSLGGLEKLGFWLVVYTLDDAGETLDVLNTSPLTLREHGASLTAAAPPNVVGALSRPQADALYATLATITSMQAIIDDLEARLAALEAGSPSLGLITADDTSTTADSTTAFTADQTGGPSPSPGPVTADSTGSAYTSDSTTAFTADQT